MIRVLNSRTGMLVRFARYMRWDPWMTITVSRDGGASWTMNYNDEDLLNAEY